ncbi:ABC transporter ATP-binding protein [Acidianus sp. RZ1]|uniref:ATP-binding cassette domain-containing protein n=1 Tax=Acidianus sp. RZ1 TaxID=1540082 RepID=UPI001491421A|nr:ABC transporter ATP-binding protein [Acidianus sp. RZ1]NON62069.1 ABC transporter ATP-binding protein [Acidianus sp. RZ1]
MIQCSHVSKSYDLKSVKVPFLKDLPVTSSKIEVLRDVTFSISEKVNCVVGPNGSGKTTLIKILSGQEEADSGEVLINGYSLLKERDKAVKSMSVLMDREFLDSFSTVKENVDFALKVTGADKSYTLELIKLLGLEKYLNFKVPYLSKGNTRKLSLLLALMLKRPVLLLDEPTNGIDFQTRRVIWDILSKFGRSSTVLMTTHQVDDIESVCERIFLLVGGTVREVDKETFNAIMNNFVVISKGNEKSLVRKEDIQAYLKDDVEVRKPTLADVILYIENSTNETNS